MSVRESLHIPVLTAEVLAGLRAQQGGSFVDCTFGAGGHTSALLEANAENKVRAFDRDLRAVRAGSCLEERYAPRLKLTQSSFSQLGAQKLDSSFDGVLADLGLSSDQLAAQRGFSFTDDAPLDMRMDETQEITAAFIVNSYSAGELFKLLKQGGVGKEARAIVNAIIAARPLENALALAAAIAKVSPRISAQHPATVTFQAIRMAVNRELEEIDALLDVAPTLLRRGGRVAIITFHSLEDKTVMRRMRGWEQGGEFSALWPGMTRQESLGKVLTRKAVVPGAAELSENRRARSARLRIFEFN